MLPGAILELFETCSRGWSTVPALTELWGEVIKGRIAFLALDAVCILRAAVKWEERLICLTSP